MSRKEPDEFLAWRAVLSSPTALPEHGLDDRELTWQRLAERLDRKPRRVAFGWWVAAACLLMVSLPASLFFHGHTAHARHAGAVHPVPVVTQTRSAGVSQPREVTVRTGSAHAPRVASRAGSRPAYHAIPKYGEFATFKLEVHTAGTTEEINIARNPAIIAPVAATAAPVRHLRIVCLNEISQDPHRPVAPSRDQPFVRVGNSSESADWAAGGSNTAILTIGLGHSSNH